MLAFDDVPPNPDSAWTPTSSSSATPIEDEPISSIVAMALKGSASRASKLGTGLCWVLFLGTLHGLYFAGIRVRVI